MIDSRTYVEYRQLSIKARFAGTGPISNENSRGFNLKLIFQRQPSCSEKNMLKKLSKTNMEAIRGDFLIFTSYSVEHLEKIA